MAPPATTLFNKFLRDGETEAASAAGIMGLLKAPAALTTRAACNFSIWFILEAITVDFLVARTATLRTPLTCLGAILAVRLFITVAFIFFFACGWCFGLGVRLLGSQCPH